MGVFTNLFQDEIDFIEKKYKIKILEIKNIDNGILNSNFYIKTKNKKYILRIYEANRTIDEEKQELILLDRIIDFIPVSTAIKNIDNEYISIFNNKKFALFEYIDGNSITKIDTHIIREIAIYLGKLHSFTKDISFVKYNRKTRINFNFYYNKLKKSEIDFKFKNELLNSADKINGFDFSILPSGVIHGDIFPDNVLLDDYNCMELKGFISKCRLFIGARTHATIAAYSTCVPTLVIGYSVKAKGIAKDIFGTYKNYVLPVQSLKNKDDLINGFDWLKNNEDSIRQHLKNFMPSYREQALCGKKEIDILVGE